MSVVSFIMENKAGRHFYDPSEAQPHSVICSKKALPRGHHYLPQFLLRGFASRQRKKQYFTWLFRLGTDPIETNLKNVVKIRDFHGNPSEEKLEENLSLLEVAQSELLRKLRQKQSLVQSAAIASLVTSIQIRSENVRVVIGEATQSYMEAMTIKLFSGIGRDAMLVGVMESIRSQVKLGAAEKSLGRDGKFDTTSSTARSLLIEGNRAAQTFDDELRNG
jgi:hypothetical protein